MTALRKILICGYSHCGTTILKSIIGHIDEVEEIINECDQINGSTNKKYLIPFQNKKFSRLVQCFIL